MVLRTPEGMEKKIKITYMIDELKTDLAGTESQLIKMINGIDKKKFDVSLVSFTDHPWLRKNAASLECDLKILELNRFGKPAAYVNFLKLVRLLREYRPDVVHTFFPMANILGVIAARLAGVKCIISSRRDYGEWMNSRYLFSTRFANRFVTKIATNSLEVKSLTEEKEKVSGSKIEVFYNGINTAGFENVKRNFALKRSLDIPENDHVVGIVANFRPMKRHQTFLKAASEVLKARGDVSFLLVGTGPLKEEMESLARSLNIEVKTRFVGSQKDVLPYLSIMDIGVNCSEKEGLSNAIMEYMCAGIPCVVAEAGGNVDLISDGYNGYTFKVNGYKTLASLVLKLLDDNAKRELFVRNARGTIKNKMSLGVILSKYENFYQSLLNA